MLQIDTWYNLGNLKYIEDIQNETPYFEIMFVHNFL